MQAAAANVTVRRDRNAVSRADVLDRAKRFGNPSHRNTDVLAAVGPIRAGPQRADRGADDRARLPQSIDARRFVGPFSLARERTNHFGDALRVPAHAWR